MLEAYAWAAATVETRRLALAGTPSMMAEASKGRHIMTDAYDSRADTLRHIRHVRDNIETFVVEMLRRGRVHDASKFDKEERAALDEATPRLRGVPYGSAKYNEILAAMAPILEHHYRCNPHHPEHYVAEGVSGMDLFDVVEMVCDWMAAARRNQADGVKLAYNVQQFGISPQLAAILANTLARWPLSDLGETSPLPPFAGEVGEPSEPGEGPPATPSPAARGRGDLSRERRER